MSAIAFRVATTNAETGVTYYSPEFPSLRLAMNEARKVACRGRRTTRVEQVEIVSLCACDCESCGNYRCCGDQGC